MIRATHENRSPVLLVGNFLSSSVGTRGVCEELADRLERMGWPATTTSTRPGRIARLVDMVGTVYRERAKYRVAQVDVYSGPAFFWAEAVCWALRRVGRPYILTLRGGNLPAFSERWGWRVRNLLGSAAAVTSPSPYLVEMMRRFCDEIELLPNPLELANYEFVHRSEPAPRLVWLRAFHEIYNPTLAPRIVARLVDEFPDIRMTMFGPDKGDASLQATKRVAAELGVSDRFDFPGSVPKAKVPRAIATGDVFVNTTDIDNTPVSVLEAMACGLCVVTTNVGGIPFMLHDGVDALLVPPRDEEAMAAAVRRVLTDRALASSLSRNARHKVEQLDWSAILPRWEAIVSAVAEGRRA